MGYQKHQFGTLYLDGVPKPVAQVPTDEGDVPAYGGTGTISIGDSNPGSVITWIQPDGMDILIADRVLLSKVSWNDLNQQGFVDGKEISIDGMRFRCRLLKVGNDANAPNEWDDILDITGEDDDLWHWKDMYFWGQEVSTYGPSSRAVRGWVSARYWDYYNATYRIVYVGFRPALEPLDTGTLPTGRVVTLEGFEFDITTIPSFTPSPAKHLVMDFRPILRPVTDNPFDGFLIGTTLRMYTCLLNGKPVRPDGKTKYQKGATISLTDAFFGYEFLISWTVRKNPANTVCACAEIPLLVDVPKEELVKQGYLAR